MKFILCKTYQEVTEKATEIIANEVRENPSAVLGLATGSSPIGIYEGLCALYEKGELDFSDVRTYNLDEYLPIDPADPNSYCAFMHKHLWDKVNLSPDHVHIPAGNTPLDKAEEECRNYDKMIEEEGGIDLQLLGIGRNGHIGFNEPAEALQLGTHTVTLTESTIAANSVLFEDPNQMPRHAITAGLGSICGAKKILLVAGGKDKHDAITGLLGDEVTTALPASLLKLHPDFTVICDYAAYYGE